MEYVKEMLLRFVLENGSLIAAGLIALAAVGMLLGSIKKMIVALFTSSLRVGEEAAKRVMEKPKGLILAGSVLGAVLPAWWIGYSRAPVKIVEKPVVRIVEKPVIERVPDTAIVNRLQGELQQAEAKASGLESQLTTSQRSVETLTQEKQKYQSQVNSLSARLYALSPSADKTKMEQLSKQLNEWHLTELGTQVERSKITREHWELGFLLYIHEGSGAFGGVSFEATAYHKQCAQCQKHFATRKEMDVIFKRHPNWSLTNWDD